MSIPQISNTAALRNSALCMDGANKWHSMPGRTVTPVSQLGRDAALPFRAAAMDQYCQPKYGAAGK